MCLYSDAKALPCVRNIKKGLHPNIGEGCKWCTNEKRSSTVFQYFDVKKINAHEQTIRELIKEVKVEKGMALCFTHKNMENQK